MTVDNQNGMHRMHPGQEVWAEGLTKPNAPCILAV
jgi:hypothetical protein